MAHQRPFPFDSLPGELQLEVMRNAVRPNQKCVIASKTKRGSRFKSRYNFTFFDSQYIPIASFPELRPAYHDALGEYILNDAREVIINIKDLDFANMRAFFNTLARKGKLREFVVTNNTEAQQNRRWMKVIYTNTKDFPDSFDSLLDFTRISNKLLEKLPGIDKATARNNLCVLTEVRSCQDLPAVAHAQDELFVKGVMGQFFTATMTSFFRYRTAEQLPHQQQLVDAKEYWDEIDRVVAGGIKDPVEHYAKYGAYEAAVAAQRQGKDQQAVGGAGQVEEMEENDPGNYIVGQGTDTIDVGVDIGMDARMEKEDEEAFREELYEPPQHTTVLNSGIPTFSEFFGLMTGQTKQQSFRL